MRPFTICLIALASAFLFSASSCDWEGDDTTPAGTFGPSSSTVTPSPDDSFIETDASATYTGTTPNGVTTATSGTNKTTLEIGVDGDSVTILDDLGNGYAGTVGSFHNRVNDDTDPVIPGTRLADRFVSFTGFDAQAGLNVSFTGTLILTSGGVDAVSGGGSINTVLTLVGTWIEEGGVTAEVGATAAGPKLNLSDFPFSGN